MNIIGLRQSAERLHILLLKYATHNEDAVSALRQCEPIIDGIRPGKICEPNQVPLPGYYFSTESSLFENRDICEEASLLAMYMEGWSSEEEFNLEMKRVMQQANIEERQLRESCP